jgi:hypothetical protein
MDELKSLNTMIFRAIFTLGRSKRFKGALYTNASTYSVSRLKSKKLREYKAFFGLREDIPLSYFYLLSQEAQASQMLHKNFPLPIPGMIHLETELTFVNEKISDDEVQIVSDVIITNKEEGSLVPIFIEAYFQKGIKIVEVKSHYLLKRKSKKKKKERSKEIPHDLENWINSIWKLKSNLGYQYARISGDYNPIHLSTPLAWVFGLRKKIIHGWYLLSRAVAEIEAETDMPAKSIEVKFIHAVPLASKNEFGFRISNRRNLEFRIKSTKTNKTSVTGYIS